MAKSLIWLWNFFFLCGSLLYTYTAPGKIRYPEHIFLISAWKHMLWVLIRSASPCQVDSNEYPQHVFMQKWDKDFFLLLKKSAVSGAMYDIDCGYSLEPPRRGGSNEYPQSICPIYTCCHSYHLPHMCQLLWLSWMRVDWWWWGCGFAAAFATFFGCDWSWNIFYVLFCFPWFKKGSYSVSGRRMCTSIG